MMTRRRFFAAVAGAPFLPFAPRAAALLPVAAAPAVLSNAWYLRNREAEAGYAVGDTAKAIDIEVRVDVSQPQAALAALREELRQTAELLDRTQVSK